MTKYTSYKFNIVLILVGCCFNSQCQNSIKTHEFGVNAFILRAPKNTLSSMYGKKFYLFRNELFYRYQHNKWSIRGTFNLKRDHEIDLKESAFILTSGNELFQSTYFQIGSGIQRNLILNSNSPYLTLDLCARKISWLGKIDSDTIKISSKSINPQFGIGYSYVIFKKFKFSAELYEEFCIYWTKIQSEPESTRQFSDVFNGIYPRLRFRFVVSLII